MAAFAKLAHFQAFLSICLLIIKIGESGYTHIDPICRCIDNYDSRGSFHDVSCYGINTAEQVACAEDYLSNISSADRNFQMTFNLNVSNLQEIPSDFLEPYFVLGLIFDSCKTSKIPKRIISPVCATLTTLQIRNGNIKKIPSSGLPECMMLSSLFVQNSSVQVVARGAFQNLFFLQELDLRQNLLQNFSGFSGIESLRMLNLAHNRIKFISKEAFQSTPLLNTIFLNNNQLETLEENAFGSLPELAYLDLSNNRLRTFSGFSGIDNLRMLNLSSNMISLVDGTAFMELHNLWMLYMDHNNVSILVEGTFNPFNRSSDFALISMEGNPLNCSCSMEWLKRWFKEHPKVTGFESATCSTPTHGSLMTNDLCDYPTTVNVINDSPNVTVKTVESKQSGLQTSMPSIKPTEQIHKPTDLNHKPPSKPSVHSKTSTAPMLTKKRIAFTTLVGVSISLLYSNFISM